MGHVNVVDEVVEMAVLSTSSRAKTSGQSRTCLFKVRMLEPSSQRMLTSRTNRFAS